MKKYFTLTLMILSITIGNFTTASAMDFLIGAKGGYFVWDEYLKRVDNQQFDAMKNGSGELYGPVFSILFTPDFSFSVSGLFGQQSAQWTSIDYKRSSTDSHLTSSTFAMKVKRIDVDSALSYRLTENFKIFAGYKYQYFDLTLESISFNRDPVTPDNINGDYNMAEVKMPFHGPAIGIGFSAPFGERFFFASNLSALYMWGKFKLSDESYYYDSNTAAKQFGGGGGSSSGITMKTRGLNFEPTIGASTGEGLPIFTLGIRAQWSQTKFFNAAGMGLAEKWANDYQYGLFVSVVQPI